MSLAKRHFNDLAAIIRRAKVHVATGAMNDDQAHGARQVILLIETSLTRFCAAESPAFDRTRFLEAAAYDVTEETEKLRRALS